MTLKRTLAALVCALLLAACSFGDPPQIVTFDAEGASTEPASPVTLTWYVIGDAVTLAILSGDQTKPDFMNVDVTGKTSYVVTPNVTTSYVLFAANADGDEQMGITVDVPVVDTPL